MPSEAKTVDAYIDSLPEERKGTIRKLRALFKEHLPDGFEERMSYGMPGFVVPLSAYPDGYHIDSSQPLPFVSYASQKNHIAIYHMGMYAMPGVLEWFTSEYPNHSKTKLDMGKSCIRFKNPKNIPFDLLGELATKISMDDWIEEYKKQLKT